MAIAYFTTWTTYGTWLPGDERGWYQPQRGFGDPDAVRSQMASLRMSESTIVLETEQRKLVEKVVADHCRIRDWFLHAVDCRTNHVHVVVTANVPIDRPREQFKSWATRRIRALDPSRHHWWTERGWNVYLDDDADLQAAITYVREGQ